MKNRIIILLIAIFIMATSLLWCCIIIPYWLITGKEWKPAQKLSEYIYKLLYKD